jgi:selenide,water dikinase
VAALAQVLRDLPVPDDANLIVGRNTADDAAVYRIAPDQAVVFTVDCFMPIHDDPFTYGQIVAANSMSDVWAMGGRPIVALNVCGFPRKVLPMEILADILKGGSQTALEAGVPIAGGHTLDNTEPFYGLAVLGLIHPERIVSNTGARPGDVVLLTKPLGTGIVATAAMRDQAPPGTMEAATASMVALNRDASEVMLAHGVSAATDVTGFGFIGHAQQLAKASGVSLQLQWDAIPALPGALELAGSSLPDGGMSNLEYYEPWCEFGPAEGGGAHRHPSVPEGARVRLVSDPQTSGGLLICLPASEAEAALEELHTRGVSAARIGVVAEGDAGRLRFR